MSLNRFISGRLLQNIKMKWKASLFNNEVRMLYAPAAMGIDTYVSTREKTLAQFASAENKFKIKMAEFSDQDSKHMIFTEDLKSMVHLIDDNGEDIQTLISMLKKFNKQNKELRFGSFVFGPVIMRMFYYLQKPDEALAAFKDPDLDGIFDQLISFQILMDLLFINEKFDGVLEVFEIIKNKQLQPNRYPKNVVVLFFAACYKLNTPESFNLATEMWKELKAYGHTPMRRATTFAAALAVRQGSPHVALEILSNEKQQNYITVRNLKAWALADLGRLDDVVPLLRSVLNIEDPYGRKHTFTEDVMSKIKTASEQCSDKETLAEYQRVEKQLLAHNLIEKVTLDSFLCQDIVASVGNRDTNQRSQFLASSYNRKGTGGGHYRQRPGLADMV